MSETYRRLERLQVLNDRLAAAEPCLIVALGDSNTCNTRFTAGAKQWPELLHERLKDHHGHQRVLLLNSGVSGDCVERVLARFETDLARFRPEGCVLCLGTNDANRLGPERFRAGMDQLLERLAALGTTVLLRTPAPILEFLDGAPDRLWPEDTALQAVCAVVRELADERELALVDTYALWKQAEAAGTIVPGGLFTDAVHTNAAGHRLVCAGLLPAFGIAGDGQAMAADGSYTG